jgi:translation initiation factor 5A
MSKTYDSVGNLKVGSFVMIDGEPCRVVDISKAKTGKHGSAKATVTAVGLFSKSKKVLVAPVDSQVEVPIIEKREVSKDTIEESIRDKLNVDQEVEYWQVLNARLIVRPR